jgi:hypothetical protein
LLTQVEKENIRLIKAFEDLWGETTIIRMIKEVEE